MSGEVIETPDNNIDSFMTCFIENLTSWQSSFLLLIHQCYSTVLSYLGNQLETKNFKAYITQCGLQNFFDFLSSIMVNSYGLYMAHPGSTLPNKSLIMLTHPREDCFA